MPYILGTVSEMTDSNGTSPCMDFQVKCLNKPITIVPAPPHFWATVPQDEYILEVTAPSGSTTAVAQALTTFGGVRVNLSLP